MDIEFNRPEEEDFDGAERRKAYRVPIADMAVRITTKEGKVYEFKGRDLSVLGVSFHSPDLAFKLARVFTFDLTEGGEVRVSGLKAKVLRYVRGVVGCSLAEPSREQEDDLYKVVLARQKRMIRNRREG